MTAAQSYTMRMRQEEVLNLSQFVVTENLRHYTTKTVPEDYHFDVTSIFKEEMEYLSNSEIFTIKDKNEILGTIRILRWDFFLELPIQKIFGINPLDHINGDNINEIWHIGRFAIKREVRDLRLLKKMIVHAIKPICNHKDNIAFAECDAKLLRVLKLMGIKIDIIGESAEYLGSETIPIRMSYSGLIDFYNENKHVVA